MKPRKTTRDELKAMIRFQLSQLSARNAHHEFEHLGFDVARLRLATNLVPATGPVQAGGDQGRDFESYRTFIAESPLASSAFVARVTQGTLVGACSLDKDMPSKIKRDLSNIFSSGTRPVQVACFCEQDIPVAKRHELQAYCRETYAAELDIFDGQALADMLADADLFWVAQKYLSISSDHFPEIDTDDEYRTLRARWLENDKEPKIYADAMEIKRGLRTATFEEGCRPDIDRWIGQMERIASQSGAFPARLGRLANYEIAVAELRGKGSLDGQSARLDAYFCSVTDFWSPDDLLDASVLSMYCAGALLHGHFNESKSKVRKWVKLVHSAILSAFSKARTRGEKCGLLEARAFIEMNPLHKGAESQRLPQYFRTSRQLIELIKETPFFPVEPLSNLFEKTAPVFGAHREYRELCQEIDELIAERSGRAAAAEKCLARAQAHLEEKRICLAIDQLQRAKIGWFSGDTLSASARAMLQLSVCYHELGLHYAGLYYAGGALFMAVNAVDHDTREFIPHAGGTVANSHYLAGHSLTFLKAVGNWLPVMQHLISDISTVGDKENIDILIGQAAQLAAALHIVAPELNDEIDAILAGWKLHPSDSSQLDDHIEQYKRQLGSPQAVIDSMVGELHVSPLRDYPEITDIEWSALGIEWKVSAQSGSGASIAAQSLAALFQIIIVELADVDILALPTTVHIKVSTSSGAQPRMQELSSNEEIRFDVQWPENYTFDADWGKSQAVLIGMVADVLQTASALPATEFEQLLKRSLENGLPLRTFSVRPVREIFQFLQPESEERAEPAIELRLPVARVEPFVAPELAWRTSPSTIYTEAKAKTFLRNRYRRNKEIIKLSLPRLLKDERAAQMIAELRSSGLLDWQILTVLSNIVCDYQVKMAAGTDDDTELLTPLLMERFRRAETERDAEFPSDKLTREIVSTFQNTLLAAAFKVWELELHRQTPDFKAMKQLLDVRFRHSTDDIPHGNPFGGIEKSVAA